MPSPKPDSSLPDPETRAGAAPVSTRPPSVDSLARTLAQTSSLPHPLLVDVARAAIAAGDHTRAEADAMALEQTLLQPVINATGVLAHTNLGRAPLAASVAPGFRNLEFDLATGKRGSRTAGVGRLLATASGAEAAMVVNNNAAAVMLVLAALAAGRSVAVSRGESVEIGGSFRVPEVMEQSGARLVDVGTTNRTRVADYRRAIEHPGADVALVLKIHPSNYRVEGFTEAASVAGLASLPVPVVADIGSGLLDSSCPWLPSGPPSWLGDEPAARQSLAAGAALVTFSGDKLLGGPQAGIIAGRADLVAKCARHPLARALRPGGLVLDALQTVTLAYLRRDVATHVPFWHMASIPVTELERRAVSLATSINERHPGTAAAEAMDAMPGAGSAPGAVIASYGITVADPTGDIATRLRTASPPVIVRVQDQRLHLDLRAVTPTDDAVVADSVSRALEAGAAGRGKDR